MKYIIYQSDYKSRYLPGQDLHQILNYVQDMIVHKFYRNNDVRASHSISQLQKILPELPEGKIIMFTLWVDGDELKDTNYVIERIQ